MTQKPNKSEPSDYYKKLKGDYEKVFSLPAGKRILEDLAKSSFINTTTFTPDAATMAFNEGHRSLVLHITKMSEPTKEVNPSQKATT